MIIRETMRTAMRSLLSNRLRTVLTALGMVIGVAAVIAVLAIGEGAKADVEGRIRSMGSNLMTVRPGAGGYGAVRVGNVATLIPADAKALAALPGVVAVSPEAMSSAQVKYLTNNRSHTILGVMPQYLVIRSLTVGHGLGFTELDNQQRARVAILGSSVAKELFGDVSPLGKRVQLRGLAFRVIGVLTEKGDTGFVSPDDLVLVPLSTFQGVIFGNQDLSSISLQVKDERDVESLQERITQLLRLRHRLRADEDDDFTIRSQTEMLKAMNAITATLATLLSSVAAVSLLVGGIGIMNIMLVTVRERTREIGVRMAVGARRRDILLQFLVEAVVVSMVGGVMGILLGYSVSMLVAKLANWSTIVPIYAPFLACGVSIGVGLIFGVGPARRAAQLDPVEALRQE